MDAAEAPAPPRAGLAGRLRWLDEGVLRIEQVLVTLAALVMTTTVTLDITNRAFAGNESVLARKLLSLFDLFGVAQTEANYLILKDYGTPTVLALVAFFVGWAVVATGRRHKGLPPNRAMAAVVGVLVVVLCWAFVQLVTRVPSRWVCFSLLELGCGAFVVYALRKRDVFGAALTVGIAAAGGWLALKLPQGYIWSQELSLILLAWMAFLGGSMATHFEKHIQVDALSKVVPMSIRPWTRALGLAATTAFCLYMTMLCYEQVFGPKGDYFSGELRPATGLPAWLIVLAALTAFGLMSVRFLARTLDAFLHPRVPDAGVVH